MVKQKNYRKNPLTINEGNIRRWLYLNLYKYKNQKPDIIWSKLTDSLTGDYIYWELITLFQEYLTLFNNIFEYKNLSEKDKLKIWRFYMVEHPEKLELLQLDLLAKPPYYYNWWLVYKDSTV